MRRLIDNNKKLQSTLISALDQFIDRPRQNKSIDIQSWVDNIAPDNLTQNADRPVPGKVSVLPKSRSTGRFKGGKGAASSGSLNTITSTSDRNNREDQIMQLL